ncbi:MAG TPA: phosphate ABC transporter substrate-binding protein PstS [Elainellaceae cyanobacterium]
MMNRRHLLRTFLPLFAGVLLWVVACQPQPQSESASSPASSPANEAPVYLNGTGASFPFFIYQHWFSEYNTLHPNVQINYQPTGSQVGIQQMISETIDFGASDVALTDEHINQADDSIVMVPMTAGSVAIAYNLPGIDSGLQLPRSVYPDIFLGKITTWNDPQLADANPEVSLPDLPIILVHRSDGSGTTAAVTRHLSEINPSWEEQIGAGLSVQWTAGVGVKANAGVSAQIQQAEGAIGYVEYSYAQQLDMSMAALENKAGQFVLPDVESTANALDNIQFPDNLRAFVPDPDGADAYPISTYTWMLAYKQYDDPAKAIALKDLLQWCLTEGQQYSEELGYVPLPDDVVSRVLDAVEQIQ